MSKFWIGTGWKMNKTVAEARDYIEQLLPLLPAPSPDTALFVIPPFTAIAAVRAAIGAAPLRVGAQNMHWAEDGSYTGEISARMLEDAGADLVELGHSERRELFGETDEAINRKVKVALAHGLTPLVCVGDSVAERDAGAAADAIIRQTRLAFSGLAPRDIGRCLIAYEPVWAIGDAGVPASSGHVAAVHARMKAALAEMGGAGVPVLYGGSVNGANAADLASIAEVDGLFIGRAAWQARDFASIVTTVIAVRAGRR